MTVVLSVWCSQACADVVRRKMLDVCMGQRVIQGKSMSGQDQDAVILAMLAPYPAGQMYQALHQLVACGDAHAIQWTGPTGSFGIVGRT